MSEFGDRYGPWALVAGASEGVGEAFARDVASRGVNVVLLARRQAVLDELAGSIQADTGVQARALAVDLAAAGAVDRVADATADLEVGLLMYCAGADPNFAPFLSQPVEAAVSMVQRNCLVPIQLCHHFAAPMVARGRGGLIVLSSGGGLAGGARMVAYGASKAFDIVMMEALWAELRGTGVDALGLVLGMTDTPALRRLLAERGVLADADDAAPIPGAATSEEVAAMAIADLANGPTVFVGGDEGPRFLGGLPRRQAVELMSQADGMGSDPEPAGAA